MNQGPDFTQEDKQQMNKLFKPLETTYQTFSSHLLAFNKAIEASKGCQWSPWGLIRLSPPMYEGVLQFIDAIQNFCAQYRPIIEAASKSESTDQSAIYFLKKWHEMLELLDSIPIDLQSSMDQLSNNIADAIANPNHRETLTKGQEKVKEITDKIALFKNEIALPVSPKLKIRK